MSTATTQSFNNGLGPDHVSNQSAGQIEARLDGKVAGNPLYSENLSNARHAVVATGNDDLIDAFKTVGRLLLTGENAKHGGSGFSLRDSVGLAVTRMLDKGDTATFERIHENGKFDSGYDALLKSSLKALQSELKADCAERGIKVHSTNAPASPAASAPRNDKV